MAVALLLFGLGLYYFVELTDEVAEQEMGGLDRSVGGFIQSLRTDGLTPLFRFITDLGDRWAYIILIIAIGIFYYLRGRRWKLTAQVVAVLVLASLVNIALKEVISRERPTGEHLVEVTTASYPSGHAMSAMAFYGFLIYLLIRSSSPTWWKVIGSALLALLILLIGTSRIYLGVHYASDVLAGFLGGLFWMMLSIVVFNLIDLLREKKRGAEPEAG